MKSGVRFRTVLAHRANHGGIPFPTSRFHFGRTHRRRHDSRDSFDHRIPRALGIYPGGFEIRSPNENPHARIGRFRRIDEFEQIGQVLCFPRSGRRTY